MSNSVDDLNLMAAYHLLRRSEAAFAERNGKGSSAGLGKSKSLKDWIEEDEALLSGETPETHHTQAASSGRSAMSDVRINLGDLIRRLKEIEAHTAPEAASGTSHEETRLDYTSVETELSVSYTGLPQVTGLVRRDKNQAETDRYKFEFIDGGTFKITDKWANKSTTIWGDPHVDVDDLEGNRDGEFSDLKSSATHTTLDLQDGTHVTFTAQDNGVIEAVDIFKGTQHLHGTGAASKDWRDDTMLFATGVKDDGAMALSQLPLGDMVRAGGDGNDWFDTSGRLIWGKTTGPVVTARPAYELQVSVKQTVTQVSYQQTIDRQF
jgi:hypothetical protein